MDFLHQKYKLFQNPNNLPLNELSISIIKAKPAINDDQINGTSAMYPAIHAIFIDEYPFIEFHPYDEDAKNQEEMINTYLAQGRIYMQQLDYLLSCNYHQFWCYMLQDPGTVEMLHSFINNFSASYQWNTMDKKCFHMFFNIYRKFATILIRLFTFDESPSEYMDPITTIERLEQVGFLSFQVAANVSVLYAEHYPTIVKETVALYLNWGITNSWQDDFKVLLDKVLLVFEIFADLVVGHTSPAVVTTMGLPSKPSSFVPSWYEDVLRCYMNVICSLHSIVVVSKYAMQQAMDANIPRLLVLFYNQFFPRIYNVMSFKRTLPYDWSNVQARILNRIALARLDSINCFNAFASYLIDAVITNTDDRELYVMEYMQLITDAIEDDLFLFDYHNINAIDTQLAIINSYYPQLDEMNTRYILMCLNTLPSVAIMPNHEEQKRTDENVASTSAAPTNVAVASITDPLLPDDVINEKINIVCDALPDLGDGFVLKCLQFYDYDPIEVLHAILDQNLPPILHEIPRGLIRVPPEPEPEKPILAYCGKKPQKEDASALLNDKTDLPKMKAFIINASSDDYDDREVVNSASIRKPNDPYDYMVNRFDSYQIAEEQSDDVTDDDNQEPQTSASGQQFRAFCENPEKSRQQRENAMKKTAKQPDVVGKPKGQGQDEKVVQNRHKKDVKKASKANHNRKGCAQWKRSRGMF